jgi:hypothetical protein
MFLCTNCRLGNTYNDLDTDLLYLKRDKSHEKYRRRRIRENHRVTSNIRKFYTMSPIAKKEYALRQCSNFQAFANDTK